MDDRERWLAASHAMQSGVAAEMQLAQDHGERHPSTEPKHLRVGINNALCDHAALVKLLIAKGLITEAEYLKAIADAMEEEKQFYEKRLSNIYGKPITLG